MSNVLQQILADKRLEVERAAAVRPVAELKGSAGYHMPRRNFYGAVAAPRARPNLIAEIKRASPSAGLIRADFDPAAIAVAYQAGGAAALSILTDAKYFSGDHTFIDLAKTHVDLPVLRKDFIVDPYQLHEARAIGADAVLLIAEALSPAELAEFMRLAAELQLCVLLEVHSTESLLTALAAFRTDDYRGGLLLGVNNRNLATQTVDLATTEKLAPMIPPGLPFVAESGIKNPGDVQRMQLAGARALLVGETLMRSPDIAAATAALLS